METAVLLFKQYSGHGMIMTLFLLALVYLWFEEKDRERRRVFVNLPIGILLLFFCPVVVFFLEKLSEEDVYWRMLWSLPILVVISYTAILLIRKYEGIKRYLAIGGTIMVIVLSGNYLYNNPGFVKADNVRHIPAEVVELCDAMKVEGREVRACFPEEMLIYVPQYTAYVHMPYGREMFLRPDGSIISDDLYELMEAKEVDVKELSKELRENSCHFVVVRKSMKQKERLEKEAWSKYYESEGYIVYLDEKNDPRYW